MYKTVVIDPPWKKSTGGVGNITLQASTHYPVQTKEEIVATIQNWFAHNAVAPEAHLYLWTVNTFAGGKNQGIVQALDVCESIGFTPITLIPWIKNNVGSPTDCSLYGRGGKLVSDANYHTVAGIATNDATPGNDIQNSKLLFVGPTLYANAENIGKLGVCEKATGAASFSGVCTLYNTDGTQVTENQFNTASWVLEGDNKVTLEADEDGKLLFLKSTLYTANNATEIEGDFYIEVCAKDGDNCILYINEDESSKQFYRAVDDNEYRVVKHTLKLVSNNTISVIQYLFKGERRNIGPKEYGGELYSNHEVNAGYYLHEKELYNGNALNEGYYVHDNKLYNNSEPNTGYYVHDNKLYDGEILYSGSNAIGYCTDITGASCKLYDSTGSFWRESSYYEPLARVIH